MALPYKLFASKYKIKLDDLEELYPSTYLLLASAYLLETMDMPPLIPFIIVTVTVNTLSVMV